MNATLERAAVRGELRYNEPMSRHSSWRAGGIAERWFAPADREDLIALLSSLPPDEPITWVGLGSNLLVRDGGLPGTVIASQPGLASIKIRKGGILYAEAGASSAQVARQALRAGLTGAEFLAGIPGTIGGALAMNAGAFGGETWPLVEAVETVDRAGVVRRRAPDEYTVGYRSVQGPEGEWFLAAQLHLEEGDAETAARRVRELLAIRQASQPTRQANCGSVFRNPDGDYAARLIEAAGLKGRQVGGAQVSEKHANFIINTGRARAGEIEALICQVADEVEQQHGVRLETEVRIVGRHRLGGRHD